jgi:hypothetical protein
VWYISGTWFHHAEKWLIIVDGAVAAAFEGALIRGPVAGRLDEGRTKMLLHSLSSP